MSDEKSPLKSDTKASSEKGDTSPRTKIRKLSAKREKSRKSLDDELNAAQAVKAAAEAHLDKLATQQNLIALSQFLEEVAQDVQDATKSVDLVETVPVLATVLSKLSHILEQAGDKKPKAILLDETAAQHVDKMINWLKSSASFWPYGKPISPRDDLIGRIAHWRLEIVRLAVSHYIEPLCRLLKKNAEDEALKHLGSTFEQVFDSRMNALAFKFEELHGSITLVSGQGSTSMPILDDEAAADPKGGEGDKEGKETAAATEAKRSKGDNGSQENV